MDGALAMDVDDDDAPESGALLEILMDDDELDAMAELSEAPVAAQISHSQIIEKQAHAISKLEKHAERAREYKTLTKVKLKEAALRLREYRLKVEALLGEVETLKKAQQASEKTIQVLQKKSSGGEQVGEQAVTAGRGKGGRGRGRGRGGRGRGRGAVASSELVVGGDEEHKAVVDMKSMGTQVETKSFADAATQTDAANRVQTAEFGVQTQPEAIVKNVDSSVQTTISGEIQAVVAPVVCVSAEIQTERTDMVENGCQCDLLTVEETDSADIIKGEQSSQVSSSKQLSSRPRSTDTDESMAGAISRKRKRSFGSTTGRGGEQPIPSALLATAAKASGSGDVVVHTHEAGVDAMLVESEAYRVIENDAGDAVEKEIALATEKQRAAAEEVSRPSLLHPVAFDEGISTSKAAALYPVTQPRDLIHPIEMPQSRVHTVEATAPVPRSPVKQLVKAEAREIDAIGAAIDAELEFSDSDEEELEGGTHQSTLESDILAAPRAVHRPMTAAAATSNGIDSDIDFGSNSDEDNTGPLAAAAAVANEIDFDIDFGSSSDDEVVKSPEPTTREAAVAMLSHLVEKDAISSAIDDELMTSDDDEDQGQGLSPTTAANPIAVSVSNDPISAAINEDLADSSDEDDNEKPAGSGLVTPVNGDAVSAAIDDELASISDEEPGDHDTFEVSTSVNAATRDPIFSAIDDELASSSDEETESEIGVNLRLKINTTEKDSIGDAIDDELASSSDEEDMENAVSPLVVKPFLLASDPISAAIDDELLSSSSDEEDAEIDASGPNEEPASTNKDRVASAIDDELGSSSDEEIDYETPASKSKALMAPAIDEELGNSSDDEVENTLLEAPVVAASVTKDPITAAIDDELASSSEDKELGDHTDEPSPVSTIDVCDPVTSADESASCLAREKNEHPGEEKTQAPGASLLMSMLYRRTEKEVVASTAAKSTSTVTHVADDVNHDESARDSGDMKTEEIASRVGAVAGVRVAKATGSTPVELPISTAAAPAAKKPDTVAMIRTASAPVGSVASSRHTPATVTTEGAIEHRREKMPSLSRSPRMDMQSGNIDNVTGSGDFHHQEFKPAPRDLLGAIGKPSLDLSSSSGSSDSDSSDSGSDFDGEESQDDFGMEYEPGVVDADLSTEEMVSNSPEVEPTCAEAVRDASPVIQANILFGGTEAMEKLSPRLVTTGDKYDQAPHNADMSDGVLSEEGEVQSLLMKRRRTLSSDQFTWQQDTSTATESSPVKRQKLDGDDSMVHEVANAAASKSALAPTEETIQVPADPAEQVKQDSIAKGLAIFQRCIACKVKGKDKRKEEETASVFVARTLLVLFKSSAQHAISTPVLVNKMRDVLIDCYRKKEISLMMMVQETCKTLQVPKIRRKMEKVGLSATLVAHQVFMGLVSVSTGNQEGEDKEPPIGLAEAEKNQLAECLMCLRSVISIGRDHLAREANLLTSVDARTQFKWGRVHKKNTGNDKVFLYHVCSFYTRICKSTGFHEAINVLLYDMLRWHPTIKGLFFTRAIVEVAPEVLRMDFDVRGTQLSVSLIKTTIHHVLAVIDTQSAYKQQRICGLSSLQLMHHIVECIHAESLLHVDAGAAVYRESFAALLWSEYIAPLAKQPRANTDDRKDAVFEVCKSLELLTTAYMQWQVMELFPVVRFQDTFAASESSNEGRAAVVKMVGAIAVAFTVANNTKRLASIETTESSSQAAIRTYDSSSGDYVLRVCEWLQELLTQEANSSLETELASACVLVELVAESAATRSRRHEMLNQVLQWFKRQPQEHQMRLPDTFLRQLRLTTLSTRPIIKATRKR